MLNSADERLLENANANLWGCQSTTPKLHDNCKGLQRTMHVHSRELWQILFQTSAPNSVSSAGVSLALLASHGLQEGVCPTSSEVLWPKGGLEI